MGSLSFLFLDDFERNARISVAIKSGSTVSMDDIRVVGCSEVSVIIQSLQSRFNLDSMTLFVYKPQAAWSQKLSAVSPNILADKMLWRFAQISSIFNNNA